ncbi:MAG TPA: PaaI family thioesterase [Caulobacteraceae bacterium]|jgi:uncharacterized protein (TIGR00369 family)
MSDVAPPTGVSAAEASPYARFLGFRVEAGPEGRVAVLPFAQPLIGNPVLPALHGGAVAAFLELAALAELGAGGGRPRTIDMTVDYLRPARPLTTYATVRVLKRGRRVANVAVEAWQEDRASPVAAMRGHFMVSG